MRPAHKLLVLRSSVAAVVPPVIVDPVENGGFDTDTVWDKGDGWSIEDGFAVGVPAESTSDLTQTIVIEPGEWLVEFDISNRTTGGIRSNFSGGSGSDVLGPLKSMNGHQTQNLIAVDHTIIVIRKNAVFNGKVDNVTMTYIG
jgi:hypothetical protein